MKKLIALLACMAFASPVFAEINTYGLSEIQIAELQKQAAELKEQSKTTPTKSLHEWGELSEQLSKTLTTTAANMGVVANDFINTPVGVLTASVVVWHYVGESALGFIVGSMVFFVGSLMLYLIISNSREVRIKYDLTTKNWFGNHPIEHYSKSSIDFDVIVMVAIGLLMLIGITGAIVF